MQMTLEAKIARESSKLFLIIMAVIALVFAAVMAGLVGYFVGTVGMSPPGQPTTETPAVVSTTPKPVITTNEGSATGEVCIIYFA